MKTETKTPQTETPDTPASLVNRQEATVERVFSLLRELSPSDNIKVFQRLSDVIARFHSSVLEDVLSKDSPDVNKVGYWCLEFQKAENINTLVQELD